MDFHGVTLSAFFSPERAATNEDDVMVLQLGNGREVFLSESDALFPFYDPQARELLSSRFGDSAVETVCFLTTKNDGAATMAMLAARNREDRQERLARSIERNAIFVARYTERRLVSITSSHASKPIRRTRSSRVMPALLTRISTGPSCSVIDSNSAATDSGSPTSPCTANAVPPAAVMASTVASAASLFAV